VPDSALYDLADQLYKLAPWGWISEVQLIQLRHPETGESGYISIMGGNGEHLCLALYVGEEALHRFNLMQEAEFEGIHLAREDHLSLILESRQIQLSFERRGELQAHELKEIKMLGRKYRGGNWPTFRSYRAGHAPMPVDAEESVWLAHAITQMLEIAPILKDDPSGDHRAGKEGAERLTRVCVDGAWQTTWTPADERLFQFSEPEPSEVLAAKVKRHAAAGDLECTFQLVPNPIGRNPAARSFPYILLSVDASSGAVFGIECLGVEDQSHEEMIASVPDTFLRMWDRHGIRPGSIRVASQTAGAVLRRTADALGVPVVLLPELPALDEALASALGSLGIAG
jgi:hypothetical protein